MTTDTSAQFYPKTAGRVGLPGSIQEAWKTCGKAGCRCAQGELHGPYLRRVWREDGRTQKAYVRQADAPAVAAAVARHKELHMSKRAFRRMLRDFDRLSDVVLDALEAWQQGDEAAMLRILQDWKGRR